MRSLAILLLVPGSGCIDLGRPLPPVPDAAAPPDAASPGDAQVDAPAGPVVDVFMSGLAFRPAVVQIPRGAVVRWTNLDAMAHTVTEGSPGEIRPLLFDSPMLGTAGQFEQRFDAAGEWKYYCRTHPRVMRNGVVQVF